MEKKVSIVSSVYNKATWLDRFFKSIINQTYKNIEYVIVNNASTDNSGEIINRYAKIDSRIKVITVEINNGPSSGYGIGLDNVTGFYFTLIDSDDYIDPDYIEKLVEAIDANNADMSMCVNDLVWDNGKTKHKKWPQEPLNIIEGESIKMLPCQLLDELNDKYLGFHMPEIGAVWNKLYKTSIIRDNGINFTPGLFIWCDFIFNLEVVKKIKKVAYINTTCYHFSQSDTGSVTRASSYTPLNNQRVLNALKYIENECIDIMTPNLECALNVFRFNRIREMISYNLNHLGNPLSRQEMKDLNRIILETPSAVALFSSNVVPMLKRSNRLEYNSYKKNTILLTYYYIRFEFGVRRIFGKIGRILGIKKKQYNIIQ